MNQRLVTVRRTGGVAGRVAMGSADLENDDDRASELRHLLGQIADSGLLLSTKRDVPRADGYTYAFGLGDRSWCGGEGDLTLELRRIAELVLPRGEEES